ncbi:MAG: Flp pilus assembly complex ATPase component TadA [Treponema sp.]|nr:Flp pilus assembly complex ATPase component TadA [Treponema sp.]
MKDLFENTEKVNINVPRLSETERQQQAVREMYHDTEMWLKAPNGKPTNLTEEQWVAVRTPNFKRWFGNWDYDENKKITVVDMTNIDLTSQGINIKEISQLKEWLSENLIGRTIINDDSQIPTYFSNKGTKDSLKKRGLEQRNAYSILDNMLKNAVYYDFEKGDGQKKHPYIYGQDVYYAAFKFNDGIYSVKIKCDVNSQSFNSTYKDHKVTEIKIADYAAHRLDSEQSKSYSHISATETPIAIQTEAQERTSARKEAYTVTISQLTGGVKPGFSKVIDENGEPLVVYHSTSESFDTFKGDVFHFGTKAQAELRAEDFRNYLDDEINTRRKIIEKAASRTDVFNASIALEEAEKKRKKFENPNMLGVFLNIRNIKREYDEGGNWSEKAEQSKLEKYDGLVYYNNYENDGNDSYAVFKPNQIKSATDNNRNFDLKNDSILFQIIGEKGAADLDKTEEATTRLDNLKIAQKMTEAGKDAKTIRLATGWECGADGKWRYEIDDNKISFYEEDRFPKRHLVDDEEFQKIDKAIKENGYDFEKINIQDKQYWESYIDSENEYVRQFIDFEDGKEIWKKTADLERVLNAPELFKAYPELRHTQFKIEKLPSGTSGEYRTDTNTIVLDESAGKSVLLHEIQHAIQYIEGFATGGNEAQFKAISIEELENKRTEINKKIVELEIKYFPTEEWLELDKKLSQLSGEEYKNAKREAVVNQIENLFANKEDSDEYKKLCAELDSLNDRMEEIKENALDGQVEIDGNLYANEYEAYRSLSGEVEARNVQTRMNMTPEERLNTPLSETEDVAQEDQIVMFDGTVAASKITSRSQYLEGKTELTDEDILHLLDLPPEKEIRTQLKSYTDKEFTDYEKDSEPLSQLTEKLKNDPEYLLYRGSYIAKSKLLYEQPVILCNEIPSLIIGQEIKESFYLLPYGYAKGKDLNYKKFADLIYENIFTDIKRLYGNNIKNTYKKSKEQGENVFYIISSTNISLSDAKGKLGFLINSDIKQKKNPSGKYFLYGENEGNLIYLNVDKNGLFREEKSFDLKKLRSVISNRPFYMRGQADTALTGTLNNINDKTSHVNDFFSSLLLRGELEMIRNHKELQKDLTIYQKLFAELEQITNQTQSELLKSSNLSFIQSEKDSQFYKDLIEDKNRNTALNTTKTKGEEKTMDMDQEIERMQANGGMSEAAMEADIRAEEEQAYQEWEEMLDDNQKAEEIIEENKNIIFSGTTGSGKTTMINEILQKMEKSETEIEQTPQSQAATSFLLDKLQKAGIEVITDESQMKAILDAGKEVQKMAAHYGTSQDIEGPDTFSGYGAYVVSLNKENAKELGLKIASKKYGNNFYIGNQSFPEFLNDRNFSQYWQTVLRQVSDNPTVEMLSNEIAFTDTKGNASLEKEQAQLETLFNLNLISYKREQTYLYSVEIPDDNGTNYLFYDKAIGKENADRINSELKRLGTNWSVTRNDTGKNVYFNLLSEKVFHSQKLSSEFLQKIGFVGMETTKQNYIIFDDREMYINNRVQYMMTENGEVYGFAYNGKIYADKELMNSNVLAHEYTHLWDNYTRLTNKDLWERGKDIFRQTHLWEEIRNDPAYQDIRHNDDEILSECHARICGEIAQKVLERIAEKDGKSLRAEVIDWNQEVNRYISEELMINPELGNENYISDTIKQEFLQQFLSMPMKDLMNGVGYKKDTFIKEIQNSMYHTKEWSENFPKVYSHSLYYGDSVNDKNYSENIKTALLVGKAKRGDRDAAIDLVNQSVRPEIIKELHKKYPDAIVCAVDGLEANGHNMIPLMYKKFLSEQGFSIDGSIVQSAKAHHTGADNLDKLLNRVRFSGEVQKGKDYILLDDHISMGSTLRDLRDYIETNGGKVVAITTLTAPEQDYKISISKENIEKLSVYGEPINEFLREYGITDNIKGLTDREASEIIGLLSDRGRNPETQEGIRRSACLRLREIQENYLKQQTQSQSLINPQKLVKQNSKEVVNLPSILSFAKIEHEELNLYGSSGGKLILDFKENPDAFCQLTGLDKEPYLLQSKGEPFTAEIHVRKNQEGKLLVDALIPDLNSTTLRLVNLENLLEKNGKEYSGELLSLLEERLMNRQEEKTQIQKMSRRNSPEWLKTPFGHFLNLSFFFLPVHKPLFK